MTLKARIEKLEERSQADIYREWAEVDPVEAAETYHRIMDTTGPSTGIITATDPNEAAKQYIQYINQRS